MGLRRGQAGLGTLGTDQLEEAQVAARSPLLMCSLRDSVPESDGCCRLPSPIPVPTALLPRAQHDFIIMQHEFH